MKNIPIQRFKIFFKFIWSNSNFIILKIIKISTSNMWSNEQVQIKILPLYADKGTSKTSCVMIKIYFTYQVFIS